MHNDNHHHSLEYHNLKENGQLNNLFNFINFYQRLVQEIEQILEFQTLF